MKALIPILVAAVGITATAAPVDAGGYTRHNNRSVEVTTGRFQTLPGGEALGFDIHGGAVMIRTDRHGGHTTVFAGARGLEPNMVYPVHVHNQPCSATPAGGSHYQNAIGGAGDDVNEIWPKITTNKHGRGTGFAVHGARARSDAMSIVIHFPADTSIRLACADLG